MSVITRNNVSEFGHGPAIMLAHGFGCDKTMWQHILPDLARDHRVVSYDLTGFGASDLDAYDFERHGSLDGHVRDLIEIMDTLHIDQATLVGHSISASMVMLAAERLGPRASGVVMVSPSPRFIDDPATGYEGGFSMEDIDGLLVFMEENHLGWSMQMAPTIAGQSPEAPEAVKLTQSFCQTDPRIARHFGRLTFHSDQREALSRSTCPSLILHCLHDTLVPQSVADWMQRNVPQSEVAFLDVSGHCPHMTAPDKTINAIRGFLDRR
ncbi:alpha/beta fold hydrolase [Profundibacterium mesophilum]|uniref:2-succinyl-6-hydroxy-2 4-cyclohexadiene-1-carboxylate synthase n=1 Tax=Profundibacterium mesophilum KAUST100406-0324 TaxID=1037889 RepID=A0A921TF28_9RHOB|nr:alpha/beta hydrolase [Profundibacterium mesophilum]KAF0676049.1 2-succinyl-6-hydroxy-2 4-cyclohexadiene-1-carboxylate synthase [Profundibacterium mesophilum KAUST100406-0324]